MEETAGSGTNWAGGGEDVTAAIGAIDSDPLQLESDKTHRFPVDFDKQFSLEDSVSASCNCGLVRLICCSMYTMIT